MPFLDLPTGIRMYFEVHGEKGDPFLFLGGTGSDHTLWTHHLPALAARFRVIVPDPRGTGATASAWVLPTWPGCPWARRWRWSWAGPVPISFAASTFTERGPAAIDGSW